MINQPWDPKRPLEGPQGQAQLCCVLSDGAGPSAPRGATRREAAARRPPSTRAAGSWRCSALPRTSAARRARAPHCAAHSSWFRGEKLLESGFTKLAREKSKAKATVGRPPSLGGGWCGPWRSEQEETSGLQGADAEEQRWGAGPAQNRRKTPHSYAKDKPWVPSPGAGAQGAGALTGRSLRSSEEISHKATIKMVAKTRASSEALLGQDLLLSSDGCNDDQINSPPKRFPRRTRRDWSDVSTNWGNQGLPANTRS
ncbi:uncharacterized protein LOC116870759 [Lontra canadensis]|uniref:uncharacterized protein LOC116870759 n=1 Tax=Lontra canadensis TaxID=76717 RepID=UPI0013F2C485|nr:uncharacterized protein LOC116870759 [Lontra canadensis]